MSEKRIFITIFKTVVVSYTVYKKNAMSGETNSYLEYTAEVQQL